ncbi:uncharacterized protein LOC131859949 isoform X2 [Cryptomeria japonica]|uniref:uncharacterized protein LOC131859949 isoform X2 n=1 Tax=Cryptomeria japonica TaxID=3369 RepID=UPI0027DA8EF0|nr:uncharacterized protein LOC131859949 isoform X2 [Cryptomeria japonica]
MTHRPKYTQPAYDKLVKHKIPKSNDPNRDQAGSSTSARDVKFVLYGSPLDPCSRMVQAYLKHKNIDCQYFNVEKKSSGKVPVLKEGENRSFFGSKNILTFFGKRFNNVQKQEVITVEEKVNDLNLKHVEAEQNVKSLQKFLREYGERQLRFMEYYSLPDLTYLMMHRPTFESILEHLREKSLFATDEHVKEWWKNISSPKEWKLISK